jgi:hypothetical protein
MNDILQQYGQLSSMIGDRTGASDSLLHVHGGLVIMFLARIITRRSLASWTPFLVVLAAALLKEITDRGAHGAWRMPDSLFDIINTVFWPLVLMLGASMASGTYSLSSTRPFTDLLGELAPL